MKIGYLESNLDDILRYWVNNYNTPKSVEIVNFEYWLDAKTGSVVFKVYTKEKEADSKC